MNSSIDYREKYLIYKKKYLDLKSKYLNLEVTTVEQIANAWKDMNYNIKSDKRGGYYLSCTLKHNKSYHVHLLPDGRWTKKEGWGSGRGGINRSKIDPFKSAHENAQEIYNFAGYNESDYCP